MERDRNHDHRWRKGRSIRMETRPDTHEQLLKSRGGDLDAFRRIVEHYQGYAYALALRLLRDDEEARDVMQEAFIRVWKHMNRFDPRTRFTTWFYRIVTNLAYDRLRAKAREKRLVDEVAGTAAASPAARLNDAESPMANEDLLREIDRLTDDLPPKQRVVFVLRDLHDMSTREVSEIAGISESSVKTNLFHARHRIRQALQRTEIVEGDGDEL
jgi:RNA polymerase sigma-70 factor (ECF subfamily)